ncbi:MAG: hypothetical protein VW907_04925 [Opitutae bacterium]
MSKVVNLNDYRPEDLVFHVGIAEINHKDGTKDYDVVIYQDFNGEQQMLRIPEDCILQTITALCEAGMAIADAKNRE